MAIEKLEEKFEALSKALDGVRSVNILSHDNPDPDSLASMMALRYLLVSHFQVRARLLYGGMIGRAENRAMVRRLKIPLTSIDKVRLGRNAWFALVDTQPGVGNYSLDRNARVLMVFDHHPVVRPFDGVFRHICENLGATCTLMLAYLRHAGLEPDWRLATAMAYGLISETQEMGREADREDIRAYLEVLPRARLRTLAKIRHPSLGLDYFRTLSIALNQTFCYKNVVITKLGFVSSSDNVHQMADFFLRYERRSWSLSIGWTEKWILLSLRSSNVRAKCGSLIRRLVYGLGRAGGHDQMAGGRIPCLEITDQEKEKIETFLIDKFMHQLGYRDGLGLLKPLIDRQEQ